MIKSGFLKAEQTYWDFRVMKARKKTVVLLVPGTTDMSLITLKLRDLKQQQSQEPPGQSDWLPWWPGFLAKVLQLHSDPKSEQALPEFLTRKIMEDNERTVVLRRWSVRA